MRKVFASYGCYMNLVTEIIEIPKGLSLTEFVDNEVYRLAYEETESWVGNGGFAAEEREEFDSDDEYCEYVHEEIESNLEFYAEEYNPDEHDDQIGG